MSQIKTKSKTVIKPSQVLEQLRSKKSQGLLSSQQVQELVNLSRIEIYRRVRKGTFPAPKQQGLRNIVWVVSDINRWIEDLPTVSYAPKKAVTK